MYHSVRARNENRFPYIVTEKHFKIQLAALEKTGSCISIEDAVGSIRKRSSGDCSFVISFDDGYADNIDTAAKHLEEKSFPFTIFITRSFTDSGMNSFLAARHFNHIKKRKDITLGAHSLLHVNHNFLSKKEIKKDFQESKTFLSEITSKDIKYYAYTGGGYTDESLNHVLDFYEAAFKDRMDGKTDTDLRRIGRINIPHGLNSEKRFLTYLLSQAYIRLRSNE
ncbi:MAG: polysaccharide deacetylase family protein [Spirochaetales bacterium]|nr:polysaccharide deacetylase family protein [Spirochaetales bacterium]